MADYLVTGKDLILVADAIRAKSGTSEPMAWPNGYKEAIEAINAKSTLHVKTGTFTLAEDAQAPEITHNLGVIPDLVIVEATDHDNTTYSMLGFMALNPALLITTAFGGLIFVINPGGVEGGSVTNLSGANTFKQGLSDTSFVCAYNNENYKYRAGWTYKWTAIAGIQSDGGGGAKEPYIEETYNANGELIEANLVGYTAVRAYAFSNCTSLTLANLPSGLTSIGDYAFYNCTKLTSITFQGKPNSISSSAFDRCRNLKTINVPWASGEVANAPWGATNATINYNYTG